MKIFIWVIFRYVKIITNYFHFPEENTMSSHLKALRHIDAWDSVELSVFITFSPCLVALFLEHYLFGYTFKLTM